MTARGLTDLSLPELERLARALHREDLRCPMTPARLGAAGLHELGDRLHCLAGLDTAACTVIVDAILAERAHATRTPPELIWTGPQAGAATGRDTAIAVRELFGRATRSVLLCGYAIDHGADIFEPLHVAMRDRGVSAELLVDVAPIAAPDVPAEAHLARFAARFFRENWPFGPPRPRLFYDPRTIAYRARVSLHAKAAIVDEEWALITSANFTERGQSRNLELGVVIRDRGFAATVTEKLRRLMVLGSLVAIAPP